MKVTEIREKVENLRTPSAKSKLEGKKKKKKKVKQGGEVFILMGTIPWDPSKGSF